MITVCYVLLTIMSIVFWRKGFDSYGTRIAVFWVWFNGFLGVNLYLIFVYTNYLGWWNVTHFPCMDATDSMYNEDYINCLMYGGGMSSLFALVGLLIDIWGAVELYRWAQVKKCDPDDRTATHAKANPTCCAFIPLGNKLMIGLAVLCTLGIAGAIVNGFTMSNGAMIKPVALILPGYLVLNIVQYVVLCSNMKNSYKSRMFLFYVQVFGAVIWYHAAYFAVTFIPEPSEFSAVYVTCEGSHDGYMMCSGQMMQAFFWDNVIKLWMDIYISTKFYEWA